MANLTEIIRKEQEKLNDLISKNNSRTNTPEIMEQSLICDKLISQFENEKRNAYRCSI